MRGSDFVDVTIEVLPRRLLQLVILIAVAAMSITGWWTPVQWYINDKAAGYTEVLSDMVTSVIDDVATTDTSTTGR